MKTIIAALSLVLVSNAHADVIKCFFTEPFYNLEINTQTRTLKMTELTENGPHTTILSRNTTLIKLPSRVVSPAIEYPRYQVRAAGRNVLILELNYKGSDGMSDFVFPYDTKHGRNYGGCESDKVKRLLSNYEDGK